MKRSDAVKLIWDYVQSVEKDYDIYLEEENCDVLLSKLEEAGIGPQNYVNPRAVQDGFEVSTWRGYCQFLDKYPEHYFTYKNPRPYEYYLEGWEPEDA